MAKKKIIIATVLAVIMVAMAAFAVSCGKDKQPEYVDYDESGTYTCFSDAGNFNLELIKGTFTLTTPDGKKTGSYVYDGEKKLTLTYSDETTEDVEFDSTAMKFGYKGGTYTLYKAIGYKLTFNVGGSTFNQTVINGTTAVEPKNPENDGEVFVGWYLDAQFTKLYNFATPVFGDTTLYGRFVKAKANEYTVSLFDGTTAKGELKTAGGKLYNLPVPTNGNLTFAGWWVSDYGTKDKLTYKYVDQDITKDTKLFAVWKGQGIEASVNGNVISWESTGVGKNYKVTISDKNGVVETKTQQDTKYTFDFGAKTSGDYTVSVTDNTLSGTAYLKNKVLDDANGFEVIDGSILVFNKVANASKYIIGIDCGSPEHNHTGIDNGDSVTFNFANCDMKEGGIVFTVTAQADGYVSSTATHTFEQHLGALNNLKVQNDLVVWDKVDKATFYKVTVNGREFTVEDNKFDLAEFDAGNYVVSVEAQAKGYNGAKANTILNKTTLAVPTGLQFADGKLTWNAVQGATSYNVKVGFSTQNVTATEYALPKITADSDISVQAVGTSASSKFSKAVTYKYNTLDAQFTNGVLTWNPISAAKGYQVSVNGGDAIDVDTTAFKPEFETTGANTVAVRFIDTMNKKSDWITFDFDIVKLDFNTFGGTNVDSKLVVAGTKFVEETTTKTGYNLAGWYNTYNGPDGNGTKFTANTTINNDTTLFAYWTAKQFKLSLKKGEFGEEDLADATVKYNSTFKLDIPVSTDVSEVFYSWTLGGERITDDQGNSLNKWNVDDGDKELVAVYKQPFDFRLYEIEEGEFKDTYSVVKTSDAKLFTTLTVPAVYNEKKVSTVDSYCFQNLYNLKTVNIPDTVKLVQVGNAFANCYALTNVNVYATDDKDKGPYSSVEGMLLYNDGLALQLKYVPYKEGETLVIPDGIEVLPTAILNSVKYATIKIPASVREVQDNAFYMDARLTSVVFEEAKQGEDEKSLTLGENAFAYCGSLKSITLPARLVDYDPEKNIFYKCGSLEEINITSTQGNYISIDGVLVKKDGADNVLVSCPAAKSGEVEISSEITKIGENAFVGCFKLEAVKFSSALTEIGTGAFNGCALLSKVTFGEEATTLTIKANAFSGCTSLTEFTLPSYTTLVETDAFGGTTSIKKLTVDCNEKTVINDGAFAKVSEVNFGKDVAIENITTAFKGITLPNIPTEGPNKNENYVFENGVIYNKEQTKVLFFPATIEGPFTLPETITEIKDGMFKSTKITSVSLPLSVTKIGASAFEGSQITSITFAEAPKTFVYESAVEPTLEIGENAFKGTKLTSVTLPDYVTSIGANAFQNCTALETATLPATLTEIPNGLFNGCSKLTGIAIPTTVTKIGALAFNGCAKLTSVTIPASVEQIALASYTGLSDKLITYTGDFLDVFVGCSALTEINVDAGNQNYKSVDGILYNKAGTQLIYAPVLWNKNSGNYVVPAGVTEILAKAFYANKGVKTVAFADADFSELVVGGEVFSNATNITTVTLKGLKSTGYAMFKGCTALETVTIGNTVENVEIGSFTGCTKVTSFTFEKGGTAPLTLGSTLNNYEVSSPSATATSVLNNATGITTLEIPARTVKINHYAFHGLTGLTSLTFENNCNLTYIGKAAFAGANKLSSLTLPSKVETVEDSAFSGCFQTCEGDATLTLNEGLVRIGSSAFSMAVKLKEITIPSTVTSIGSMAFAGSAKGGGATNLATVTFAPNSHLVELNSQTFELTSITEFTLPETVVDDKIFVPTWSVPTWTPASGGNQNDTYQIVPTAGDKYTSSSVGAVAFMRFKWYGENEISFTLTINEKTESYHFTKTGYAGYVLVEIKNTFGLKSGEQVGKAVIEVAEHEGTMIFEKSAFCTYSTTSIFGTSAANITKINLSDSLATECISAIIGGCTKLDLSENELANKDFADKGIILGTTLVEVFSSYTGDTLEIPDGVTIISANSLKNCKSRKVIIPASVVEIEKSAFYQNKVVEEIEFAPHSQLKVVGNGAFREMTALKELILPDSIESMDAYVAFNCTSLTQVHIPTNPKFTILPGQMFYGCTKLESVVIPDNITEMYSLSSSSGAIYESGGQAFYGCTALKNVTLPKNLTLIGGGTFNGCTSLLDVKLPSSLVTIGAKAFYGCKFEEIVIPEGVVDLTYATTGGYAAFQNCTNLKKITFLGKVQKLGYSIFRDCSSLDTIEGDLSELLFIGQYAFAGTAITSFTVPKTLTMTANYVKTNCKNMFDGCTKLESVTLEEGLKGIPAGMFNNCSLLTEIAIPASVEDIGTGAFTGTNISSVIVDKYAIFFTANEKSILFNKEGAIIFVPNSVSGELTLEIGQSLGANAFDGVTGLTKVVLPEGLTAIPNYAFRNCTNLEQVVFPSSLTSVGQYAFQNCSSLTNLVLPEAVTTLSSYCFQNCSGLKSIYIPDLVTTIPNNAFDGCENATSIRYSDNVTAINNYAFRNCKKATDLKIPANYLVGAALGNGFFKQGIFEGCESAFADGIVLYDVTFNSTMGTSGAYDSSFKNCKSLTSFEIAGTKDSAIEQIGASFFEGCTSLSSFKISVGTKITTIGAKAFKDTLITEFTLPATVTSVGANAFENCVNLKSVHVTSLVRTFNADVFKGCTSLETITIDKYSVSTPSSSKMAYNASAFANLTNSTTINVGYKASEFENEEKYFEDKKSGIITWKAFYATLKTALDNTSATVVYLPE